MIFQTIKDGKIKEKTFNVFGMVTGNKYDRLVFAGKEINEISKLPPLELKEYINHLAIRATLRNLQHD